MDKSRGLPKLFFWLANENSYTQKSEKPTQQKILFLGVTI